MKLEPLERSQTASALPDPSNATCGTNAFWPAAERSTGAPNAPPAGRTELCTMKLEPSQRSQTASALPDPSNAACGTLASWPAAERSTGAPNTGAPADADAANTSQHDSQTTIPNAP